MSNRKVKNNHLEDGHTQLVILNQGKKNFNVNDLLTMLELNYVY